MQRITLTLDEALLSEIDALGYGNRSEAIRDLARAGLRQLAEERAQEGPCVAALAYVYDHARRDLSQRLTDSFHEHHNLSVATLHVHLDHDRCMEVTVLRGLAPRLRAFADSVISQRGVRHGRLMMMEDGEPHSHEHAHE
ncbi:nickel-responsive transcriptional regulator NikR [Roseomonas marmotae]|uniref:Putative nickel-responsive regulator n=1 Tax=Roseomonas marmotae TaxID=2768161 RepID=A0ABS3KGV6_9PROT|nr:nickel-responsive transcriptional regulator NikR [Roseomonas marmotae]MBO1076217.1 nickel-responsive transcriptional regulator NikR [Roseomonas marmotae]QTI81995.1 nickel-responsive transcriptional regulator NikR [Roseomonas marmotae]